MSYQWGNNKNTLESKLLILDKSTFRTEMSLFIPVDMFKSELNVGFIEYQAREIVLPLLIQEIGCVQNLQRMSKRFPVRQLCINI